MAKVADPSTNLPRPVKTYHKKVYDRIAPKNAGFDGKGKTVLVSGGAAGIGLAISKAYAEAGASRVVIVSRSASTQTEARNLLEPAYPKTLFEFYQGSITNTTWMTSILETAGSIDVLVLNAARNHKQLGGSPSSVDPSEVQDIFETNVVAPFDILTTYLRLPKPAASQKTVISIGSSAAHMVVPGLVGYGPSKAAFTQVMQHLASEQGPDGVKMYSVHPGGHYTPMTRNAGMTEDSFDFDDIDLPAHFCLWLSSPEATFLHGRMVWAHWDVDELVELKPTILQEPNFLTIGLINEPKKANAD